MNPVQATLYIQPFTVPHRFKRRVSGSILLLAVSVISGLVHASDIDHNKTLVKRFVMATNELDFAALDRIVAADVVRHSQSTPGLVINNLADFKAFLERDAAVMDGARVDVETLISEGDRVALYGSFSGTHVGSFGPIEPTGKTISVDVHAMFRISEGRIVEFWILWDNAALLMQLGHSPFGPVDGN